MRLFSTKYTLYFIVFLYTAMESSIGLKNINTQCTAIVYILNFWAGKQVWSFQTSRDFDGHHSMAVNYNYKTLYYVEWVRILLNLIIHMYYHRFIKLYLYKRAHARRKHSNLPWREAKIEEVHIYQ